MRIKSVVKYYLSDLKKTIIIFYCVLLAAVMLLGSIFAVMITNSDGTDGSFSGGETTTIIFIFVVGLCSFKQYFLFFTANGVSRKAQFYGFLVSSLAGCTIMAIIDILYANILPRFFDYESVFYQIYGTWSDEAAKPLLILTTFIWSVALYLCSILAGYLITLLYYRMTKVLKIIVSVGVPVLFTTILPVIDSIYTHGRIFGWLADTMLLLGGLKNGINPYIAVVSLLAGSAVIAALSYLLARRAVVKT